MRYLNTHADVIPSMRTHARRYRREHPTRRQFGTWIRLVAPSLFLVAYEKWWLKHPELYGVIYEEIPVDDPGEYRGEPTLRIQSQ